MIQKEELKNLGILTETEQYEPGVRSPQEYKVEEYEPKSNLKLNTEDCTNFNELSSIYENTEEELWTPDRDLKIDYSAFQDYKKLRKNRENGNFHSVAVTLNQKADFYERMDYDVKERNIRDYEIRRFSKKRINPSPSDRRLSHKKAESLTKRLHSNRESSVERRLKNSKSLRILNLSNNSNTDSNVSKLSSTRKSLFLNHRKSIIVRNKLKKK